MYACKCGKEYKSEKYYKKHIQQCPYYYMDEDKVLYIGEKVLECFNIYYVDRKLLKECAKNNNIDDCYKFVRQSFILKYKKMFWDIYVGLTKSIPNNFLKEYFCWLKKKYRFNETIIGIKNFVLNKKRLYSFLVNNLDKIIDYQLEKDLDLISELYKEFGKMNEILVEELIVNKDVSYYFMVLNDYFNQIIEERDYFKNDLEYISEILVNLPEKKLKYFYKKVNKNNKLYFQQI